MPKVVSLFLMGLIFSLWGCSHMGSANRYPASPEMEAQEQKIIAGMTMGAAAGVQRAYDNAVNAGGSNVIALRDAHAKAHSCVKAQFIVEKNLPKPLQVGVFGKKRTYEALVRFSNGAGEIKPDQIPDGRGMAIKLLNTNQEVLLDDLSVGLKSKQSQDFLMINYPVFFSKDVFDYAKFLQGKDAFIKKSPNANAIALSQSWKLNPMQMAYFSQVPYLFGHDPDDHTKEVASKFRVVPCTQKFVTEVKKSDPNYFQKNLMKQVRRGEGCFKFQVQLRPTDERFPKVAMPVEDATVLWSELVVPFKTLATVRIPQQREPLTHRTCEGLSFNPWHAVVEQRPLGGINRARKEVMKAVFEARTSINHPQ